MYDLPVHRYRELKHFCLQYHDMKEEIERLTGEGLDQNGTAASDETGRVASSLHDLKHAVKLIETTAFDIGKFPGEKILKIVTEDVSLGQVCSSDREKAICEWCLREFFYMLSKRKGIG